jgi:tetratricopeptide (TPR) repeat protein
LPRPEADSRAAIQTTLADSVTWSLVYDPDAEMRKSALLSATWDTLGWVLFREGKLEEARSYVKAAWMNRQLGAVAEHLGEIEEAIGNKSAALRAYELGLASTSHSFGTVKKELPEPDRTKLQQRVNALKKSGVKVSGAAPQQALQDVRTFSLGPAHGMSGSAQYWLMLSDGTVGNAKTLGTSDVKGGEARLKKARITGYWPPQSSANLVRKGILFCGLAGCQLVLVP